MSAFLLLVNALGVSVIYSGKN